MLSACLEVLNSIQICFLACCWHTLIIHARGEGARAFFCFHWFFDHGTLARYWPGTALTAPVPRCSTWSGTWAGAVSTRLGTRSTRSGTLTVLERVLVSVVGVPYCPRAGTRHGYRHGHTVVRCYHRAGTAAAPPWYHPSTTAGTLFSPALRVDSRERDREETRLKSCIGRRGAPVFLCC